MIDVSVTYLENIICFTQNNRQMLISFVFEVFMTILQSILIIQHLVPASPSSTPLYHNSRPHLPH